MTLRYLEKFVTYSEEEYFFPTYMMEWDESGDMDVPTDRAVGADGSHDYLGVGIAPRADVMVSVRFLDDQTDSGTLEVAMDAMRALLHPGGLGKLYTVDSDDTRRWSQARIVSMPPVGRRVKQISRVPVALQFRREPYWYNEFASNNLGSETLNYVEVLINNPGNAYVKKGFVFTLTADAEGGFANVIITNVTTNEQIRWKGSAGWTGAVLRIDNTDQSITYLSDPGLVIGDDTSFVGQGGVGGPDIYEDSYALTDLGDLQSGFINLAPGVNTIAIQVEGSAAYTWEYRFFGAWE